MQGRGCCLLLLHRMHAWQLHLTKLGSLLVSGTGEHHHSMGSVAATWCPQLTPQALLHSSTHDLSQLSS